MPKRRYTYRLVVDHWPTPNGKPFADQSYEFWEQVIDDYANGVGPGWLPGDLSRYSDGAFDPARYTHIISEDGEPDVGWNGSVLIHVPIAPTRRFFSRRPVVAMAKQLREWGCRAHVERAEMGEWEVVKTDA